MPLTRSDFLQLADVRIAEAAVLLANGLWDGAFYLAGYAVECALKACIAKLTKAEEFPDKEFVARVCCHNLEVLIEQASKKGDLSTRLAGDPAFAANWRVVLRWNERSRYERKSQPEQEASNLYKAITDPNHWVLPWIKQL